MFSDNLGDSGVAIFLKNSRLIYKRKSGAIFYVRNCGSLSLLSLSLLPAWSAGAPLSSGKGGAGLSEIAAGGESGEWPKERSELQSGNDGYVIKVPSSRGFENIL